MTSRTAKIADGDTLVIPASVRRELGLEIGDTVIVEISNGELHIRAQRSAIAEAQRLMRQLVPEGVGMADDLIADRREEAARE